MKVESCILKAYPKGPISKDCFEFRTTDLEFCLNDGEVLIQLLHISVDPYMRSRFFNGPSYLMDGFKMNQPIESACLAKIIDSKHDEFPKDTLVGGMLPWQTIQVVDTSKLQKLAPIKGISTSHFLGIVGMTGLSAYLPFQHFAKESLKKDSIVMVSGAAGAVGSVFGQLCKNHGCMVYGSAGSPEKVDFCQSIGFDKTFNYKNGISQGLYDVLDGKTIDLYFDNVGGEMLDQVLTRMTMGGKIICCGGISQYDNRGEEYGLKNSMNIFWKSLTIHGFLVGQWMNEWDEARQELTKMVQNKQLVPQETVLYGFDKVVDGFLGLFDGKNMGKMIISLEN